jgi:hypothetical protein
MMVLLSEERLINSSIEGSVAAGLRMLQNSMNIRLAKKVDFDHIAGLPRLWTAPLLNTQKVFV